ncbi:MAG: Lrp/AsnC family transcriptional regulator [Bryobacteraceae bacterium]
MTYESEAIDAISWELLRYLQEDARISFAELARRLNLSAPAVAERVRRLEDAGIVTGYRAVVDPARLGLGMTVFIRIQTPPGNYPKFNKLVVGLPEVLEFHHMTGSEAFLVKAAVASIPHLESLLGKLSLHGQTTTSVVLSSPLTSRIFTRRLTSDGPAA